jgi:2-dehydropantoate 2-reductase
VGSGTTVQYEWRMSCFAILGPGGVGGFVAAALDRAGEDVVVVGRESTVARIRERGIDVASVLLGEFNARPRATAWLRSPVDVLMVATKSAGLEAALERIETEPGVIVPLINGLDHMQVLRERFDARRVAAGTIRIESDRPRVATIVQTSPSVRIELASENAGLRGRLEDLAATLDRAQVPARIGRSEAQILWSKLVRLNALACTTSAADRPIGFIRTDPGWRRELVACIAETTAVANVDGAEIDGADLLAELDAAHAYLGSSMRRDLDAGRSPELDAIPGSVLRAAKRHGLRCPTIARLSGQIARRAGVPEPVV